MLFGAQGACSSWTAAVCPASVRGSGGARALPGCWTWQTRARWSSTTCRVRLRGAVFSVCFDIDLLAARYISSTFGLKAPFVYSHCRQLGVEEEIHSCIVSRDNSRPTRSGVGPCTGSIVVAEHVFETYRRCHQMEKSSWRPIRAQADRTRQVHVLSDGTSGLFDLLDSFNHACILCGDKLNVLLTISLTHEKTRFELAFVFPKYDGSLQERRDKKQIVRPRQRISNSPPDRRNSIAQTRRAQLRGSGVFQISLRPHL